MFARAAAVAALLFALSALPLCIQAQAGHRGDTGFPPGPLSPGDWGANRERAVCINGAVRALDNSPITDARLELRELSTGAVHSQFTGAGGTFEFCNLSGGYYELTATQGLTQATERLSVELGSYSVVMHLDVNANDRNHQTMSVAQMQVPGKARNELHKAEELLQKDKLDGARHHLEKALEIYPRYAQAHMALGFIDLQQQRFQDASGELENSIQMDPNTTMAYVGLGAAYNALGRFDDALRTLDNGKHLSPSAWQFAFESSKAQLGKHDFNACLQQVNRAQQLLKAEYPPIHLVKAHALMGLKAYDAAVDELEKYLSGHPQDAAQATQTLQTARAFAAANK